MKKHIIFGLLAVVGASFSSCNDFLDDNRYPLDEQTNNPAYWTSEINVQSQVNQLYTNFTGYGSGGSWVNDFYYRSLNDDQCTQIASGAAMEFARWTYKDVPSANSVWDASYVQVRRCNYIINNSNIADKRVNDNLIGQARLIRAMQYYELVRALGDVPLVTTVLDPGDAEVYGERTPRNEVMDLVLEDLDFAIEHITTKSSKVEFSVDLANAMKTEICLYEAAYSLYHKDDKARAKKFYGEVVKAANEVIAAGYTLNADYQSVYIGYTGLDANAPLGSINNPEIIFLKAYKTGTLGHSTAAFLSSETKICGMTKDAFDAYLFKDGKPLATTSLNKSDKPVVDADGNFDISAALEVRDGRLAKTIDSKLAFGTVTFRRTNSNFIQSTTGYTIHKFVNPETPHQQTTTAGQNSTCAPIYWLSWIYCNYLEARAELGELTDADVTNYVKPLWDRAGIDTSNLNKAYLENMADPANNMGVSSLLWELRRLRRCELMFDRNQRYWDLVRWHKLDLLDTASHPNIVLGANVADATDEQLGGYGKVGNYINGAKFGNTIESRVFTNREYLQPLGSTIIRLYSDKGLELEQNPGWEQE
ncbi:MAG: RagB/SusD family nutrient uptake outer membrane protein [Bacteroidales bacterium]|nr:RagB/SusD family nutrient uptake outer membrane protein [Bacteroidales bacterium]